MVLCATVILLLVMHSAPSTPGEAWPGYTPAVPPKGTMRAVISIPQNTITLQQLDRGHSCMLYTLFTTSELVHG